MVMAATMAVVAAAAALSLTEALAHQYSAEPLKAMAWLATVTALSVASPMGGGATEARPASSRRAAAYEPIWLSECDSLMRAAMYASGADAQCRRCAGGTASEAPSASALRLFSLPPLAASVIMVQNCVAFINGHFLRHPNEHTLAPRPSGLVVFKG